MDLELVKLIILILIIFSLVLSASLAFIGLIHKTSEVVLD